MTKNSGIVAAIVLALAVPCVAGAEDAAGASGAATFASRCAVCHGPKAGGIPGTFPSLHEQIVAFATTPQGRDYLVMVVTTGLMGELQVGTVRYNNVMPAQSGLSESEVAAVLNYLAASTLSAEDVKEIRARHSNGSPQATRALRPVLEP